MLDYLRVRVYSPSTLVDEVLTRNVPSGWSFIAAAASSRDTPGQNHSHSPKLIFETWLTRALTEEVLEMLSGMRPPSRAAPEKATTAKITINQVYNGRTKSSFLKLTNIHWKSAWSLVYQMLRGNWEQSFRPTSSKFGAWNTVLKICETSTP